MRRPPSGPALLAQGLNGVEARREGPPAGELPDVVEGRQPCHSPAIGIHEREIGKGHDGGDGLTRPLDHDALSGRGFIDDLAEPLPNLERCHGSHGAIIAVS